MRAGWLLPLVLLLVSCSEDQDQVTTLADLLEPGRVVVLGELHGTNELPAAVADAAADADVALWVGLEIPNDEQARLDAYLASAGDDAASAALLDGPFWQGRDGRSSVAMAALIDRIRELRTGGADIELGAFDASTTSTATERDRAMADAVESAVRPDRAALVLVGSVHALLSEPPFEIEPGFEPMAMLLLERGVDLVSLRGAYGGGEAWNCTADSCGVHTSPGEDRGDEVRTEVGDEPSDGHHGFLYVPRITAADPARA